MMRNHYLFGNNCYAHRHVMFPAVRCSHVIWCVQKLLEKWK